MMNGSNVLVPRMYLGNLRKVEIKQRDISCGEIKAPSDVTIYIEKESCVNMQFINMIKFYLYMK